MQSDKTTRLEQSPDDGQTANALPRLTRRQALRAGAGIAGAFAAIASGILPALAQQGGDATAAGRVYLPYIASPDESDASGLSVEEFSKRYNWKAVEAAMGNTHGTLESGVFRIDLPRTDIQATIAGIAVEPDFALDGEVNFQHKRNYDVMKFEVVLLDTEVNPVLDGWFAQNLKPETEIFTALHNHYLQDSPPIKFVHGFAVGKAVDLASALYEALSKNSGTPFGHGEEPPGDPGFDYKKVEDIIGGEGMLTNGVLSVSVERKESPEERDVELEPAMGFEHMLNFQSIGGGAVATIDEFVVLKNEADPVSRKLRKEGFLVTALHNHELDVDPNFYYVHAWATGDPIALATSIRSVLELTNSKFK